MTINILSKDEPFLHKEEYQGYQVSFDNLGDSYRLWLIEGNQTYIFSFQENQIPKLLGELERKASLGIFDESRLKSLCQMFFRFFMVA